MLMLFAIYISTKPCIYCQCIDTDKGLQIQMIQYFYIKHYIHILKF